MGDGAFLGEREESGWSVESTPKLSARQAYIECFRANYTKNGLFVASAISL